MHEHEIFNEDNLEKVFGCRQRRQRHAVSHGSGSLGDDHEFSREVLDEVKNKGCLSLLGKAPNPC